jgi:hypothetical protein
LACSPGKDDATVGRDDETEKKGRGGGNKKDHGKELILCYGEMIEEKEEKYEWMVGCVPILMELFFTTLERTRSWRAGFQWTRLVVQLRPRG